LATFWQHLLYYLKAKSYLIQSESDSSFLLLLILLFLFYAFFMNTPDGNRQFDRASPTPSV